MSVDLICEIHGVKHRNGACPQNNLRAKEAMDTLEYFSIHGGEYIGEKGHLAYDMIEQNMSDLLCNFSHLCDLHGVEMGDVLRRAKGHYDAETANQGQQQFYPLD